MTTEVLPTPETQLPSHRPEVAALAELARTRLAWAIDELGPQERQELARMPLDVSARTTAAYPRDRDFMFMGRGAERLAAELASTGGPSWAASYGRLLILHLLGQLPSRTPELAIPIALWPVVEAGIRRLIDEAEPVAWDGDFQKDLAVALLRAIPNDAIVLIALRKRPRNLLRAGRPSERLAVLREFGLEYVRRGWFLGIHQWRGVERWMREPGEPHVLRTADLMAANPRLVGVTHSGWINDPQLDTIAPAVAARAEIYLHAGGYRYRMRNAPSTVEGALATSKTRRRLYEEGAYKPANYGIIVKRSKLLAWAHEQPVAPETAAEGHP